MKKFKTILVLAVVVSLCVSIVRATPILRYEFENNSNNLGTLGASHNGILHGNGSYTTNAVSGNYALDLSDAGYVSIPATYLGPQISITAWIKLDQGVSNIQTILSSWTPQTGFSFGINTWTRSDHRLLLETWEPDGTISQTYSIEDVVPYNEWHHVALTIDRTADKALFYFNGNLVSNIVSNLAENFTDNKPLTIGRYTGTPSFLPFHFDGLIDDLRVYSTIVPEPATIGLLMFGSLALLRKRQT